MFILYSNLPYIEVVVYMMEQGNYTGQNMYKMEKSGNKLPNKP